ncbi:MFS transporter [Hoeflea sp. TYP-13]|uniref:MFS transporter n=1 Tax=Hoeflea sp. TYP-13 TaxID=3230023 RepID=UPI0034C5D501
MNDANIPSVLISVFNMARRKLIDLSPFLLLLFCGTVCAAMIVPYMGYFLVEGLGQQPWLISVYSFLVVSLTIIVNRDFARRIDAGHRVFPLVGIAAAGYLLATATLAVFPYLCAVLIMGVLGFGVSSSAVSTMFSLGGSLAERHEVDRKRFNAYMRATTSTAWMLGPAVAFVVADQINEAAVFVLGIGGAVLWLGLWWLVLPRDITTQPKPSANQTGSVAATNHALWIAAAFVFCLSSAHSLTFSALPLFYVQEVGLPGYAPGTAFSVKTFVEVFAIFATPFLIAKFGMRNSLLVTTLLAVVTIQILASVQNYPQMLGGAALEGLYYGLYASLGISYVQSFAPDRPARATAIYWNTLMISSVLAGPAVGFIAQAFDFRTVVQFASVVALCAAAILMLATKLGKALASTKA